MKRHLIILVMACASMFTLALCAQNPQPQTLRWTGVWRDSEVMSACSANDAELSPEDALTYVMGLLEFQSSGECADHYTVDCILRLVPPSAYPYPGYQTDDDCHWERMRDFIVTDACGATATFTQYLFIDKTDPAYENYRLPDRFMDGVCDFELENEKGAIMNYLSSYHVTAPSCWGNNYDASYSIKLLDTYLCSKKIQVTFVLTNTRCSHLFLTMTQNVELQNRGYVQMTMNNGNLYTELDPIVIESCGDDPYILPSPIKDIEMFPSYGVSFSNYINKDAFNISHDDTYVPDPENNGEDYYLRMYTIENTCRGQVFSLPQEIHLRKELTVRGFLEDDFYEGDQPNPPYSTLSEFQEKGAVIKYTCDDSELSITNDDESFDNISDYYIRHYTIASTVYSNLTIDLEQVMRKKMDNPQAFSIQRTWNSTMEGVPDGGAQLNAPSYLSEGNPNTEGHPERIFKVIWHNVTLNKNYKADPNDPDCDIFRIDNLEAGYYTVSVYPISPNYPWNQSKPVFEDDFIIGTREIKLDITVGPSLGASNLYGGFFASMYYRNENYDINNDTIEEFVVVTNEECSSIFGGFLGEWQRPNNTRIYSPMYTEFDLTVIANEINVFSPQGIGGYQTMVFYDEHFNDGHASHLQRYIVLKWQIALEYDKDGKPYPLSSLGDAPLYYRLYNKNDSENRPVLEVSRCVAFGQVRKSNDPNEIFGPVGYTDADSVCVRMINANDDMNYTIMFENDPEFATAAAARVKIICPLSDKMDPTTFRLGNFGFNNMTFEVPELSSYYNKRLQIDSLGYCLDVTAALNPTENYAYWIFQTIDPETGVAPIDSLGFLPVNDTLTGCGEGFVSFTVGFGHNGNLHTADSIVENAEIYFDENAVVPTNNYVNQLDVVAPSSYIVCDTTGAFQNLVLPIRFVAADDEGGSGVQHIELYANVDQEGFELIASVHPDSLYAYSITHGAHFEFFGLAVDNVDNKEAFKPLPELVYMLGNPPTELLLSNNVFNENDATGTAIGNFSTIDDQNSDFFQYALVNGEGGDDNNLFRIEGNRLLTAHDFRCHGTYDFNIRVRTTDLSGCFLEKTFRVFANETEHIEPVTAYKYLCPGDDFIFGGQLITEEGIYYDTLISYFGCDSVVRMEVRMNPMPETTFLSDATCYGYDYTDNGFNLTADSIAALAQGWTMEADLELEVDNYEENAFGCYDVKHLQLTVHPAYEFVDEVTVCPVDLPYRWQYRPYFTDTIVTNSYTTALGCDSTFTLRLTLNPNSGTQSDELSGWKWYSTYIDQANGKGLGNLQDALGDKGLIIKSMDKFNSYASEIGQWAGNLLALNNAESYKIQTSSPVTADVSGCYVDVQTVPINLHQGWNWIGFPSSQTMDLATAMGDLPTNGDMVKSQGAFSTYVGSVNQWIGSLTMLQPGEGYQYESNNPATVELVYPSATRASGTPPQLPEAHWLADEHRFADNVTFIGLIQLDGQAIESDTLEVGAFCRGEERGSARALYVEPLDAYRVFLTVHGANGDTLSFRLFDHNRDKERRIRSRQQEIFLADNHYGTIDHPYPFNFNTDYDKLIEAEICEGQYYVDNGFRAYREGTYFQERQNDSIIRLDLTVNPVYHEEKSVVAFEFPFNYNGMVFDGPGIYNLQYNTAEECDSTLALTVQPYDGLRELLISPAPAERDQRVTLFFPFKAAEQSGLQVEIFSLSGNLIQVVKPKRFPIELDPFTTSGTYMVKITMGTGEVVTGKIIVK